MPVSSDIDFNTARNRHRKAIRVALLDVFGDEPRNLAIFLDDELGFSLHEFVEQAPFNTEIFDLIKKLAVRGRLDEFMQALYSSEEYGKSHALSGLLVAWRSISGTDEKRVSSAKMETEKEVATTGGSLERILDPGGTRIDVGKFLKGIAALERRVCLLLDDGRPVATGFLIGPGLIMTTAYVVHRGVGTGTARLSAQFDFRIHEDGAVTGPPLDLGAPISSDPSTPPSSTDEYLGSLDYALIPIKKRKGKRAFFDDEVERGWFDLTGRRKRLREGEQVFMLHHALGGPMMMSVAVLGNAAPDQGAGRIAHSCPTEPGSGGAPLVDATLRLVGMHEMKGSLPLNESLEHNIAVRADWIARALDEHGVKVTAPP